MRILQNGNFYTLDKRHPWAQAVVIDEDKIIYVGTNEGTQKYISENSAVSDLKNHFATPGFIDGHTHPICNSIYRAFSYNANSEKFTDIIEAIKQYVLSIKDHKSVFGFAWDTTAPQSTQPIYSNKSINKKILDDICKDKPVVMLFPYCREGICNSLALKIANITKDTPDFDRNNFDYFQRDAEGNPTGYFAGRQSISRLIESYGYFNDNNLHDNAQKLAKELSSYGLTTLVDCGNFYFAKTAMEAMANIIQSPNFPLKIFACGFQGGKGALGAEGACFPPQKQKGLFSFSESQNIAFEESAKLSKIYNSDKLKCNFMKATYDGTKESVAKLPYLNTSDDAQSNSYISVRDLVQLGYLCAKQKLDLNVHIAYSDATHNVLEATRKLREKGYNDMRITISHSTFVDPNDLEKFAKYNVIANSTGSFITSIPPKEELAEAKKISDALSYPLKSIINLGGKVGIGSDCALPSMNSNPLYEIEQVITRQAVDDCASYKNDASEGLTVAEAIEAYTINNAYQIHVEDKLGSIEVGKYADIAILDKNLFEIDPHEIHNVRVLETISNGQTSYKA